MEIGPGLGYQPASLLVYRVGPLKKSARGVPCLRRGGFALTGLALFAPFALTYFPYALGAKAPAALSEERHVLGCTGWAGETEGLFEQASSL
ncbi:MAG: hypothetical protein V3U07_03080 [Nitrospirales bacterium]